MAVVGLLKAEGQERNRDSGWAHRVKSGFLGRTRPTLLPHLTYSRKAARAGPAVAREHKEHCFRPQVSAPSLSVLPVPGGRWQLCY